MSIRLQKSRYDRVLFTTGELSRLLDMPESKMQKAIREDVIRPLGNIGRSTLIAVTEEELDDLKRRFLKPAP
jgi:hypothetical protein